MARRDRPVVEFLDVTVGYTGAPVLENVSLRLEGPGLVQVLGPNGAGKTTLLKTLLGLLRPLKGRVLVNGVDVTGRPEAAGRYTGYVPQLEPTRRHYPLTVWELVETECLLRCKPWPRLRGGSVAERVAEALQAVGLPRSVWGRRLSELSGGQLQRALIARSFIHDPPVLVMDEPLSAVDPAGKRELARLVARLAAKHLVVMTSHDPMLLLEETNTIILVNRGIVAVGPPEKVLQPEILRKVYGEAVLYVREHYHIADEHYYVKRG